MGGCAAHVCGPSIGPPGSVDFLCLGCLFFAVSPYIAESNAECYVVYCGPFCGPWRFFEVSTQNKKPAIACGVSKNSGWGGRTRTCECGIQSPVIPWWHNAVGSPFTVAGPCQILTGFPILR